MKALAVFSAQRAVRLVEHPEPPTALPSGGKLRTVIVNLTLCGVGRVITIS